MSLWNLLRRVRIRGLVEGLVQRGSPVGFETDARDSAERFQDYGFAANPIEGEGLRIEVGGHTFILRMDRLAERPRLDAYEVSVWHKEGHCVTLRQGRVIDVDCGMLNIVATEGVNMQTPLFSLQGNQAIEGNSTTSGTAQAATVIGTTNVQSGPVSLRGHTHGNVQNGTGTSAPPTGA
ncbi:baseplate assembly protein [Aquabacterium sp.]|uniref:baseplate assembly protein n=1 Tax=Aquabacterium sp. TaxID=1872578 RepID=UPI0035C70C61